jgi:hypothetical protein
MLDLKKPIPSYLNTIKNIISLIGFTSIFALVFINIYSPFGVEKWFDLTDLEFFTYSSLVILTGVMVVVISRFVMYHVSRNFTINIWQYLLWIFSEILFMALFYAIFEKHVLKDPRLFTDLVKISARNTVLVLLLPYSASWLYFSWRDKKEQIERLAENLPVQDYPRDMIAFYDEKQILRLSVKKETLLYIESEENYVSICYLDNNKVVKYLLRETLKNIEERFSGTELTRCHRSFIVNFDKVKIIRKENDGLKLGLDTPVSIDIPVSKTYVDTVMQTFSKYYRK